MEFLQQGLHADIEMDRYVSDPAPEPSLSKGMVLTLINRTPAHARIESPRLNPGLVDDSSSRADIGSAVHAKILGGQAIGIVEADNWMTKAAKEAREDIRANGGIALLCKDAESLDAIADAVFAACANAGMPLEQAVHEQTAIWKDGDVWCRARPDALWLDQKICGDLKTTKNADPQSWIKTTLLGGGYFIQPSHYLRGIETIRDESGWQFRFVVCEIEKPFGVSIIGVDGALLDLADQQCTRARAIWAKCLRENKWPSYSNQIAVAELPTWVQYEWENRRAILNQEAA